MTANRRLQSKGINALRANQLLVTGGAGFIGSALVRHLIAETDYHVVVVDKLTYAGNLSSLDPVAGSGRLTFIQADICDRPAMSHHIAAAQPCGIIHLAAETHVDRSLDAPDTFIQTNVVGTGALLSVSTEYWRTLSGTRQARFRFHHVSTDEVFGSLAEAGFFTEHSPYDPRSPYSASKAASDHLARAWHHTYGLPVVLTNCSNNYGPYQFPDKLIPLMIIKALRGEALPVYGDGGNVRDWLQVDDHVSAIRAVFERGVAGESYVIGGRAERTNLAVVHAICSALDLLLPRKDGHRYRDQVAFVADRPGHDFRYAIDPSRIEREIGWTPQRNFDEAIVDTVRWYLHNSGWWQGIVNQTYLGERLGLARQNVCGKDQRSCAE